ncbi:MAG: hypothetical protein ABSE63_06275 [Thermoguttaceae bacterium]|jgi:hypothetical protein
MKRAKKILLWTGISLGTLIAILLICAACYSWILGSRLEKELAAVKAAGDPICLADLARKPILPEQNGATYLLRAKDDMNAVVNEVYDLKSFQEWQYYPEDMKKIKAALDAYPKVFPLLQQAASCPDFDSKLDYNLPPSKLLAAICDQGNSGFLRAPARYLQARTKLLIFQGDRNEALQSAILMLQLSHQLEHEPLLINYLVTKAVENMALECANEVLQSGPVSDQTRTALDAELALHGSMDQFRKMLRTERAYSLDCLRHEFPRLWVLSNQWQLTLLDAFKKILNSPSYKYSDWAAIIDTKSTKSNSMSGFTNLANIVVDLMRPALHAALTASSRTQAQTREIRIINALQKKVPQDSDKVPTMAEFGLPDEVGIDPFNGKPMIIKKLAKGWLVYSVGENLKDDGGKVEEESNNKPLDVGFGPKIPAPQSQEKEPAQ